MKEKKSVTLVIDGCNVSLSSDNVTIVQGCFIWPWAKEPSMFGKAVHLASKACYGNVFHQTD
jgi:hypothetical protein